jgi:hypothetical protein
MFPTYGLIDVASAALTALWSLVAFLLACWLCALGSRFLRCF